MKTELVIVVDRSGSMYGKHTAATKGINALINDQKEKEGYCRLTLVEFDDEYSMVYSGDIKESPTYTLKPRNSTRLNDAIGTTITDIQKRITKTGKKYRPDLVIFALVTDGGENASIKYTRIDVSEMLSKCKDDGWQFTYLCNDYSSELYGKRAGFDSVFKFSSRKYEEAYKAISTKTTRLREVVRSGASKEVITQTNQFTMAEKEIMK